MYSTVRGVYVYGTKWLVHREAGTLKTNFTSEGCNVCTDYAVKGLRHKHRNFISAPVKNFMVQRPHCKGPSFSAHYKLP
jgi:hypothetical protein